VKVVYMDKFKILAYLCALRTVLRSILVLLDIACDGADRRN
jgi:hypothetical protein